MEINSTDLNRLESSKKLAHAIELALQQFQQWQIEHDYQENEIEEISLSEILDPQPENQESNDGRTAYTIDRVLPKLKPLQYNSEQTSLIAGLSTLQDIKDLTLGGMNSFQGLAEIDYAIAKFSQMSLNFIEKSASSLDFIDRKFRHEENSTRMLEMFMQMIKDAEKTRERRSKEIAEERLKRYVDNLEFMLVIFDKSSPLYKTTKAMFNSVKAMRR